MSGGWFCKAFTLISRTLVSLELKFVLITCICIILGTWITATGIYRVIHRSYSNVSNKITEVFPASKVQYVY